MTSSKRLRLRITISWCPMVNGSNDPGKIAIFLTFISYVIDRFWKKVFLKNPEERIQLQSLSVSPFTLNRLKSVAKKIQVSVWDTLDWNLQYSFGWNKALSVWNLKNCKGCSLANNCYIRKELWLWWIHKILDKHNRILNNASWGDMHSFISN